MPRRRWHDPQGALETRSMRPSKSTTALALATVSLCMVAFGAGCGAETGSEEESFESSEVALTSRSLRGATAVERVRMLDPKAGALHVEYAPEADPSAQYTTRVPFEAVAFTAERTTELTVAGDFPSSATLVATNENFEPLATARTVRDSTSSVSAATVRLPAGDGPRLVLVRDPKWVKPMSFQVRVRQ